MKFSIKRTFSFILAVLMMINVIPTTSFAAETEVPNPGTRAGGYTFTINFKDGNGAAAQPDLSGTSYHLYLCLKIWDNGWVNRYYISPETVTPTNGTWTSNTIYPASFTDYDGNAQSSFNIGADNVSVVAVGLVEAASAPKNVQKLTSAGYDQDINKSDFVHTKVLRQTLTVGNKYYAIDKLTTANGLTSNHTLTFVQTAFEPALDPYDVLGDAAEYGIVAKEYIQHMHTETNFAVQKYQNIGDSAIDVDANNGGAIPFYVAEINSGRIHFAEKNTSDPDIYLTDTIPANKVYQDRPYYTVTLIRQKKKTIEDKVDELIKKYSDNATTYAGKAMIKSLDRKVLDTTGYPDGITLYVDGSSLDVDQAGWVLKKLKNQTIVINLSGSNVTIKKEIAEIYNADLTPVYEPDKYDPYPYDDYTRENHYLDSNTKGNGGSAGHNTAVEELLLNHVVFNAYNATKLDIAEGPAGIFLATKSPETRVEERSGSGTGWIATTGTFEQFGSEWHFFRTQRKYKPYGETAVQIEKELKDETGKPVTNNNTEFTFTMYNSNEDWATKDKRGSAVKGKAGETIGFPKFTYEKTDMADAVTDQNGPVNKSFYYIIKETIPDDEGNIDYDTNKIYIRVDARIDHWNQDNEIKTTVWASTTKNDLKEKKPNAEGIIKVGKFVNNYKTAQLTVTKTWGGLSAEDLATITKNENFSITITGKNINPTAPGNGKNTITLHWKDLANGSWTSGPLAVGETFNVTESVNESILVKYNKVTTGDDQSVESGSVTIAEIEENEEDTNRVDLVNNYVKKYGALTVKKTWSGDDIGEDAKKALSITITGKDIGGEGVNTLTIKYKDFTGDSYTVNNLPSGEAYSVTETNADNLNANYTLVTAESTIATAEPVVMDENGKVVELTNKYAQKHGALTVKKTWSGDDIGEDAKKALSITITGKDIGGEGVDTIDITYDDFTGDCYTVENLPVGESYSVTENNAEDLKLNYTLVAEESTTATANPILLEDENGIEIELTNMYEQDVAKLTVAKTATGLPEGSEDKLFKFSVKIGNEYLQTTDGELGTEEFWFEVGNGGKVEFPHLPVGTYEVAEDTEDAQIATCVLTPGGSDSVVLEKNDDKTLTLTNDYIQKAEYTPLVTKLLTADGVASDAHWLAEGFSFTLTAIDPQDGAELPDANGMKAQATANGQAAAFGKIIYNKAGEYKYQIHEVIPDGADEDLVYQGITYTDEALELKVVVGLDDASHKLVISSVTYSATAPVAEGEEAEASGLITNTYEAKTSVQFFAKKVMKGRDLGETKYTFVVKSGDEEIRRAQNEGAEVTFDPIDYTTADMADAVADTDAEGNPVRVKQFSYTISEMIPDETDEAYDPTIAYDEQQYDITVTVTDNLKGEMTVTAVPDITTAEFVFTNIVVSVLKTDFTNTDTVLPGAEFEVYEAGSADAGEPVFTFTTGTTQTAIEGLRAGQSYALRETKAPNGYLKLTEDIVFTVSTDGTVTVISGGGEVLDNNVIRIKDTMKKLTAAVLKVWDDDENRDGIRPAGITVKLLQNGEPYTSVELKSGNNWAAVVKDLPAVDSNCVDYEYTWEEGNIAGYTLTSTNTVGTLTTLTNTYGPEETVVNVKKVWAGDEDDTSSRPGSITVQLYADGKACEEPVTLDSSNNWKGGWTGLKKNVHENGLTRAIVYTVAETTVPEGYVAKVTGKASTGFVITNTRETGKLIIEKEFDVEPWEPDLPDDSPLDIPVIKTWNDNNNADGNRPVSVTVRLMRGDTEVANAQLNEENNWRTVFTGLERIDENKERILYTITEDPVEWYEAEIHGYNIRNNYKPELTDITVRKEWVDKKNAQKLRPTSIIMTLNNGMSVKLTEMNGWSATIEGLPTRVNGKPFTYTWTEQKVLNYEQTGVVTEDNVTIFTNTVIEPPTTPPGGGKPPKTPGKTVTFEEYETPLGIDVIINHVGDCFD